MDTKRKKELLQQWKNRHPEMGVISFRCKKTGESFLGISKDTKADLCAGRLCFWRTADYGGMVVYRKEQRYWRHRKPEEKSGGVSFH